MATQHTRQSLIAEIRRTLTFGETHGDIADIAAAQTETLTEVLAFLESVTVTPAEPEVEQCGNCNDDLNPKPGDLDPRGYCVTCAESYPVSSADFGGDPLSNFRLVQEARQWLQDRGR